MTRAVAVTGADLTDLSGEVRTAGGLTLVEWLSATLQTGQTGAVGDPTTPPITTEGTHRTTPARGTLTAQAAVAAHPRPSRQRSGAWTR